MDFIGMLKDQLSGMLKPGGTNIVEQGAGAIGGPGARAAMETKNAYGKMGSVEGMAQAGGMSSSAGRLGGMSASGMGGGPLGLIRSLPIISDERRKQDIKPSDGDATALLEQLRAMKFRVDDGQEQLGIMAQDVEKAGPMGKAIVSEQSDGTKTLDARKLSSATIAALIEMNDRVKKLEKK